MLQDVLLKRKEVLGSREVPSEKASSEKLKQYASFDFFDPDQEKEAEVPTSEPIE